MSRFRSLCPFIVFALASRPVADGFDFSMVIRRLWHNFRNQSDCIR